MDRAYLKDKRVLVMGLGRFGGGVDCATFAAEAGADVVVTDLAGADQLAESLRELEGHSNIVFCLGEHRREDFEQADVVIANPAVPLENEFLRIARDAGAVVTSQVGVFFELCPASIVGITGANGKSTTAALTAYLLEHGAADSDRYERVWLGGNIGNRPLLGVAEQIGAKDVVVLELSSFQIEQLAQSRRAPKVAVLTNLTPNHLDRYGTFERYCAAKEGIFAHQVLDEADPAVSIFNADDAVCKAWFERYNGQAGRVCVKFCADEVADELRGQFGLPGRANLSNLAAALAVVRRFGIGEEAVGRCLSGFEALEHRLELVGEVDGVRWYNDSKATTPDGTIVALEAFDEPTILIAGGHDKQLGFDALGRKISERAKAVVLIGQTSEKILAAIRANGGAERGTRVERARSLAEAVDVAGRCAVAGDVVVLSPACASYDMFDNYEQRGNEFARLVRQRASWL